MSHNCAGWSVLGEDLTMDYVEEEDEGDDNNKEHQNKDMYNFRPSDRWEEIKINIQMRNIFQEEKV